MSAEARLLQILKRLWELPVDIRISGQASKLKLSPRAYTHLGNLPLLAVFDRPLTGWSSFLKSAMDRCLALLFIVVFSPVLALTALAVRLDSKGPILFKQRRYGFNNELIEVYKFRSMYVERSDADATRLVSKGDPRVTPVGRFIRKTSLDELPQLFNVLKGDLSLVGPRRSMAGAARPTPRRRSSSAFSTTSIISISGRSVSISIFSPEPPWRCSRPRTPIEPGPLCTGA